LRGGSRGYSPWAASPDGGKSGSPSQLLQYENKILEVKGFLQSNNFNNCFQHLSDLQQALSRPKDRDNPEIANKKGGFG
jgi:hypothetical protein